VGHVSQLPGNHDVDRTEIDNINEAGLSKVLNERSAVNDLLASEEKRVEACRRLETWNQFHDEYYGDEPPETAGFLAHVHRLDVRGTTVGVAALNSAWRCSGDGDEGRLLVGARQVEAALKAIAESDVRVAASHHPLSWLDRFDRKSTAAELERGADLILSGHEHEPDPRSTSSANGDAIFDPAGCLYASHEYPNSYSIIDVRLPDRTIDVTLRTWWPERAEFDAATNVLSSGVLSFSMSGARARSAVGNSTLVPPTDHVAGETRYVLLLDSCMRIANDVALVGETIGAKYRSLQLALRHKPALVHGARDFSAALDQACPGIAAEILRFLEGPFERYVAIMKSNLAWLESRAEGETEPQELSDSRKAAHRVFLEAKDDLNRRLQSSPGFATAIAEQEQDGLWRILGYRSQEDYQEYIEPTMRSLTESPGELAEEFLREMLDKPVDPHAMEAEGVPKPIAVGLVNRLLASGWAQWQGGTVTLTKKGARLVERRLAEWKERR
jgi:hypothetical protein